VSRTGWAMLVLVGLLGLAIRAPASAAAGFPLNDGGLFYQMVLDLGRTWPALPETTSYNGLEVPFAYPPLGFYLGSALHGWLGIDVMRVVPVAAAVLTVPAFLLLARGILGAGAAAWVATIAFALIPRSFEWMTMGGGLTRAPGLLLAIVALWLTHRMLVRPGRWDVLATGACGGLVVLTHPQAALFIAISGALLLLAVGRNRAALARASVAVAIAAAVVAPWLVTVLIRHGPDPVLSASATQPGPLIGLLSLLSFQVTGSRLFDVLGLLTAMGLLAAVLRRRWLLPAWLVVLMVLDSRGGATYASVPAAMLIGTGVVELLGRMPQGWSGSSLRAKRVPITVGALLLALALVDAAGSQQAPSWPGVALSDAQRDAMSAAGELAPDAEYLVVSGRLWAVDATAEWFPTLAGARSAGTVQGHEWLGRDAFRSRLEASAALRECANAGSGCLSEWSEAWGITFTHVFVPKGSLSGPLGDPDCCVGLRLLLAADDGYAVIHDGPGATIFERLDG
jgi:hypothetical protein